MNVAPWSIDSLSLDDRRAVEETCTAFEDAYLRGEPARIEEYLRQAPDRLAGQLLHGLIRLEIHYTSGMLRDGAAEEYRRRFPGHESTVDAAMQSVSRQLTPQSSLVEGMSDEPPLVCLRCLTFKPADADANLNEHCPTCGTGWTRLAVAAASRVAPMQFGRFTLTRSVGEGQFGTVWLARDTALGRNVAIKIPRNAGLQRDELQALLREARAAAQLQHPNIVTVYDACIENDTLCLVADYVEGCTLAEWNRHGRTTPREAARFCQTLAEALHFAHEAGVVHRDLKPSNILLRGGSGESPGPLSAVTPLITDFGLAKREKGDATLTEDGRIVGTPAYMPPEQARGQGNQADRRSDVYALGVILYELIARELPFQGQVRMLLYQIEHELPPRPSDIAEGVPKDLETITLKCLEKDPQRRYPTAKALAEDLDRFLRREPIHARPVSALEKCWRWCERNPAVALWSASFCVVLLIGFAGVTWQWRRAVRFGREADASAREAGDNARLAGNVVKDFMTTISEEKLLDAPGVQPVRRELLEKAQTYFEELAARPASGIWAQEESARAKSRLGYIQYQLGQLNEAAKSFEDAAKRLQRLEPGSQEAWQLRLDRAEALASLGLCKAQQGDAATAEQLVKESVSLRSDWAHQSGASLDPALLDDNQHALLTSLVQLAKLMMARDFQPDEARAVLEQAFDIARRPTANTANQLNRAIALAELQGIQGEVHRRDGNPAAAIAARQEAVKECETASLDFPRSLELRQQTALALVQLGQMQLACDDFKHGRDTLLKARDLNQTLVDENPTVVPFQEQLAVALDLLGIGEMQFGDVRESIPFHRQTIDVRKKMMTLSPASEDCAASMAQSYLALAAAYSMLGDNPQSLAAVSECVPMLEHATDGKPDLVWLRRELLQAYGFRAQALLNSRAYADALRDVALTESLQEELAPKAPNDPFYVQKLREVRCIRVSALCGLLRWRDALQAAEDLAGEASDDPRVLAELADILAAEIVSEDQVKSAHGLAELRAEYKKTSLRLLELAIQNGFDESTLPQDGALTKLRAAP